jgi:hypothetical protein
VVRARLPRTLAERYSAFSVNGARQA